MTFEEFRASRVEIDDVRKAGRHALDDSETGDAGYEYATGLYVSKVGEDWPEECRRTGPCHLVIGNEQWIGELADLERKLYDSYAYELVDEPFAVAGASAGLI
jgi:hypothetical protein